MINTLYKYYREHPLRYILLTGLIFRLLAAIFSKGFGWIDDQFLVVEIAQSWVDGTDYYSWLPGENGNNKPKGFSFFYVGLNYILLYFLDLVRISDPQTKMFVVRLIHALWSMLTIYYGYKITLLVGTKKSARFVGWLMAVFWIFPFLSVRTLVEFVSIPFFMIAIYLVLKVKRNGRLLSWIWIGFLFGLAINVRYQTALIAGGVGLAMLMERKWRESTFMSIGVLLSIGLFQGLIDYFVWGKPFIQMSTYVLYNVSSAELYTVGPWYHYLLFLLGALIPPVSIFIMLGYLRSYKKLLVIFIPVLLFIVFHSWYPNKQERFIVTIVPLLFISGVVGWKMLADEVFNPPFMRKFIRISWIFFLIINFIALIPISMMYSKKARVESMTYLSRYKNIDFFLIEDINKDVLRFPPQFYLGYMTNYNALMKKDNFNEFKQKFDKLPLKNQPDFILFYQPNNIEERVEKMKTVFPQIEFETMIEPGMMDAVLHYLNPINDNQNIYIYRNKARIPEAIND